MPKKYRIIIEATVLEDDDLNDIVLEDLLAQVDVSVDNVELEFVEEVGWDE